MKKKGRATNKVDIMILIKKCICSLALSALLVIVAMITESVVPRAVASEGESSKTEAEVEIAEEDQATIDMIREFWKREYDPSREKLVIQPFKVPPRKGEMEYYPCMECHEDQETNPKERELTEEHDDFKLEHGGGRFWCITCHLEKNRDFLRSLKNEKIDFNASYLLCGQCHSPRQKDWYMGAHGKRVGTWYGERLILLCVECHNPHSPSIKRKPADPPPKGIREIEVLKPENDEQKVDRPHKFLKVWEKIKLRFIKEQKNDRTK